MAQVVKLERGDVLVLANVGDVFSDGRTLEVLSEALRSLGLDQVLVFEGDVDLSKARDDGQAKRGWLHWCDDTLVNIGVYEKGDECGACHFETRPDEVTAATVTLDSTTGAVHDAVAGG